MPEIPSRSKRKHFFTWRKKDKKPTVDTPSMVLPAFEHPCADHLVRFPRCHSPATTSTAFHESGTSFLTSSEEGDSRRPFDAHSSWTSPCRPAASKGRPQIVVKSFSPRSIPQHIIHCIPPPSVENVPEQFVRTNHTSQDDDDSTEDKDYVEALQEQELIELAMEMSLRDSEGLPSPCSSLNSTASFTSQRLLELLPAPLLLDETESERLDRLERELLEMVIQASQTDL